MADKKRQHKDWIKASGHDPKPKPKAGAKRQDDKNTARTVVAADRARSRPGCLKCPYGHSLLASAAFRRPSCQRRSCGNLVAPSAGSTAHDQGLTTPAGPDLSALPEIPSSPAPAVGPTPEPQGVTANDFSHAAPAPTAQQRQEPPQPAGPHLRRPRAGPARTGVGVAFGETDYCVLSTVGGGDNHDSQLTIRCRVLRDIRRDRLLALHGVTGSPRTGRHTRSTCTTRTSAGTSSCPSRRPCSSTSTPPRSSTRCCGSCRASPRRGANSSLSSTSEVRRTAGRAQTGSGCSRGR
jgi:hypothetical protein